MIVKPAGETDLIGHGNREKAGKHIQSLTAQIKSSSVLSKVRRMFLQGFIAPALYGLSILAVPVNAYASYPTLQVVGGTVYGGDTTAQVPPGEDIQLTANDPVTGKMFSKWVVSPTTVSMGSSFDCYDPFTVVTMPTVNVKLTAVYVAIPKLTVVGGGVDGADTNIVYLLPGDDCGVYANDAVPGKVFLKWSVSPAKADLGEFFCTNEMETSVTMPATNVTLTAVYIPIPKITVSGGCVDGSGGNSAFVLPGEQCQILANAPAAGQAFCKWVASPTKVDLGEFFCTNGMNTIVIMPATNVTLTALYIPIPKLSVISGSIGGEDANPTLVMPGEVRQILANSPASGQMFDKWTVSPVTANLGDVFDSHTENTAIIMPPTNVTLTVAYIPITKLTVVGGGIAGEEVNPAPVMPGDERQVFAEDPAVGMMFDHWKVSPASVVLGELFDPQEMATTMIMPRTNVTLTANYIPMPKLTVIGGGIEGVQGNTEFLIPGDERYVHSDTPVEGKCFEKWLVLPSTADLGANFNPREEYTRLCMPTNNVTLTAAYVKDAGAINVRVNGQNEEPSGIFWSIDNKTWAPANDGLSYAIKPGKYTVTFKSKDSRWLPPEKQVKTIISGMTTEVIASATYVPVVSWLLSSDSALNSGTVVLSPANGCVLPGKNVTLTASPASGYVFVGWEVCEGMKEGAERSRVLTVAPRQDMTYVACFREKDKCEAPVIDLEHFSGSMVGVAYETMVSVNSEALPVKFSAMNLPGGLSLDAETGVISGVPTNAGTYFVTLGASNCVGTADSLIYQFTVRTLPSWARGSFDGVACVTMIDPLTGFGTESPGTVAMTVSSRGQIIGKVSCSGTNYAFKAASYSDADEGFGVLYIDADAKSDKVTMPLHFSVWSLAASSAGTNTPASLGAVAGWCDEEWGWCQLQMRRNVWQDTGLPFNVSDFSGYYTATLPGNSEFGSGYLTITVDSAGRVKTAGKLADGTAVSFSGPLIMDEDCAVQAVLYTTPASYKGGCFFGVISFVPTEAGSFYIQLASSTSMMLQGRNGNNFLLWKNNAPEASNEFGSGFSRDLDISGGMYDKLTNLRDFYESGLYVNIIALPQLDAVVKYTDFDGTGRRTWTETNGFSAAEAASPDGLFLKITPTVGEGIGLAAPRADVPAKIDEDGTYDYSTDSTGDGWVNTSGLTFGFTRATGLFKGSFKTWYDYTSAIDYTTETETQTHTSKTISFEGVLTPVRAAGAAEGRGFYLWARRGEYAVGPEPESKVYSYSFLQSCDFLLSY